MILLLYKCVWYCGHVRSTMIKWENGPKVCKCMHSLIYSMSYSPVIMRHSLFRFAVSKTFFLNNGSVPNLEFEQWNSRVPVKRKNSWFPNKNFGKQIISRKNLGRISHFKWGLKLGWEVVQLPHSKSWKLVSNARISLSKCSSILEGTGKKSVPNEILTWHYCTRLIVSRSVDRKYQRVQSFLSVTRLTICNLN